MIIGNPYLDKDTSIKSVFSDYYSRILSKSRIRENVEVRLRYHLQEKSNFIYSTSMEKDGTLLVIKARDRIAYSQLKMILKSMKSFVNDELKVPLNIEVRL